MLFHWGLLVVFLGHLAAFLLPKAFLAWHGDPLRLIVDEVVALAFGLGILLGLVVLFARRISRPRLWVVTSRMDVAVELVLMAQVVLGLWVAIGYRWGYYWFAAELSPYLWSLVTFTPSIEAVSAMPVVIKLHIAGAFVVLGLVPFSRLVHFLVAPFHYLWRPYQQVVWNWDPKKIRDPNAAWTKTLPRNN
jgi:nitrate reductase gamma subunit